MARVLLGLEAPERPVDVSGVVLFEDEATRTLQKIFELRESAGRPYSEVIPRNGFNLAQITAPVSWAVNQHTIFPVAISSPYPSAVSP